MLIDVVGVDQWLVVVVRQQPLGQRDNHLLGVAASLERLELGGARLAPCIEVGVHAGDEGGKLRVLINARFYRFFHDLQVDKAGAVGREERLAKPWADGPIRLQRIRIGDRDAALEMALNVLQIFRRLAVDVARQVEIEVVLGSGDFLKRNDARGLGRLMNSSHGGDSWGRLS